MEYSECMPFLDSFNKTKSVQVEIKSKEHKSEPVEIFIKTEIDVKLETCELEGNEIQNESIEIKMEENELQR